MTVDLDLQLAQARARARDSGDAPAFDESLKEFGANDSQLFADLGGLSQFGVAAGLLFEQSPEGQANIIQKRIPGSQIVQDADGNLLIEANGVREFVNKPGITARSLSETFGQLATFAPAGRLAATGATLGAKAGLGATGSAATDVVQQGISAIAGAEQGFDPQRAATTGAFGAVGEVGGEALQAVTRRLSGQSNQARLLDERAALQESASGLPAIAGQTDEAITGVSQRVAQAAREAKQATDAAFRRAREQQLALKSNDDFLPLINGAEKTIREAILDDNSLVRSPHLAPIRSDLRKLRQILRRGGNIRPFTLRQLEAKRRAVGTAIGKASRAGDRDEVRILQTVKSQYDDWLDGVIEQQLFSGDPQALNTLKDARLARTVQAQLFERPKLPGASGVDPQVQSVIGKLAKPTAGEAATAGEAMNLIFGASKLGGKQSSVKVLRHLKTVLGEGSQEWNQLRQVAIARLWQPAIKGDTVNPRQLSARISDALDGAGTEVMGELFDRATLAELRKFQAFAERQAGTRGSTVLRRLVNRWQGSALAGVAGGSFVAADPTLLAAGAAAILSARLPWDEALRAGAPAFGPEIAEQASERNR